MTCRPTMDADIEPFLPGDLLFFMGDDPLSRAIAWRTRIWFQWPWRPIWSHVGICADAQLDDGVYTLLFESTTLNDRPCVIRKRTTVGVQAHFPHIRVKYYEGEVWRLRPSRTPSAERLAELSEFLVSEIGKPYDLERAKQLAAFRRWFGRQTVEPTPGARFCSELSGIGCKILDMLSPERDCEDLSPNDLGMVLLHSGNVWPLNHGSQSRQIKGRAAA